MDLLHGCGGRSRTKGGEIRSEGDLISVQYWYALSEHLCRGDYQPPATNLHRYFMFQSSLRNPKAPLCKGETNFVTQRLPCVRGATR